MYTPNRLLLFTFTLLAATAAFAQVNCTTYFGGETSCYGPRGYHAEGRQYFGGIESWYDNRGNTATVRHYPFGGTSIDTTRPTIGIRAPIFIPSSAPLSSGFKDAKDSFKETLAPSSASEAKGNYDYSQLILDESKLAKTPEEYRLRFLWMKAVEAKDFEKADELKGLVFEEQFKNASPAGRVSMFKKAKEERWLEQAGALERLEKRVRVEYQGNSDKIEKNLKKFKEMAWKAFRKQEAKYDELLDELVWRQKLAARDASIEADLEFLKSLIGSGLSEAEIHKKTDEMVAKWKVEDERHMVILDARLNARLNLLLDEKVSDNKRANPIASKISAPP
ncbi:MAG: hypothetical protein ACMG51_06755 [Ginsengibacter sp.]